MAKRYQVTPHLVDGRASYAATFRNATGVRVHRGLGTEDQSEAGIIAAALVRLWTARVEHAGDIPSDVSSEKAIRLYFGEKLDPETVLEHASHIDDTMQSVRRELKNYSKSTWLGLTPVLLDRIKLRRENDGLRVDLATANRTLSELRDKHRNLETSILARAAKAGSTAAPLYEVLTEFFDHIHTKTSRDNARKHVFLATEFVTSLPNDTRSIADVLPAQIAAYIDSRVARAIPKQRQRRRHKVRQILGRFVNWACTQCEMPSLMTTIETTTKNEVLRERGDIHWHELVEVNAAIKALGDPYWEALVSTLAFAGLRLAELCWLRVSDLEWMPDGTAQFWITTVEDPDDATKGHAIKAENSRRHVRLHPKLLQPLIRKHINEGRAGKTFLFPMPNGIQRRTRRINGGSSERWQVGTLSTIMRGHKGAKGRKAVTGKLPPGMHAKSLRRTFGSLLLRSGKTTSQVAAAMGNDETMVKLHYARLKGCEVDMDF